MHWYRRSGMALAGVFCCLSGLAVAETDCYHPFPDTSRHTPEQLRQVAKKCDRTEIANLFYNRAYHRELLEKFQLLSRLHQVKSNSDLTHYHTQRIYIALSEAFARRAWEQGEAQAPQQLNRQYDRSIEIAEYQLKGYDKLATRIKRSIGTP